MSTERDPLAVFDLMLTGAAGTSNLDGQGGWRQVGDVANLVQAVWLRLNTPEGRLADLGHPDYGSRLYLLIGELDSETTRERARLYVARALAREPRIAEVLTIQVASGRQGTSRYLDIAVTVRPVGRPLPLTLQFPVFLEPAASAA